MGKLVVTALEGKGLPAKDSGGLFTSATSDPYLVLQIGTQTFKTKVVNKNLNPYWNETFTFTGVDPQRQELKVQCYDYDVITAHDSMGHAIVHLHTLPRAQKVDTWVPLSQKGQIHLILYAEDFGTGGSTQQASNPVPQPGYYAPPQQQYPAPQYTAQPQQQQYPAPQYAPQQQQYPAQQQYAPQQQQYPPQQQQQSYPPQYAPQPQQQQYPPQYAPQQQTYPPQYAPQQQQYPPQYAPQQSYAAPQYAQQQYPPQMYAAPTPSYGSASVAPTSTVVHHTYVPQQPTYHYGGHHSHKKAMKKMAKAGKKFFKGPKKIFGVKLKGFKKFF